MEMVENAFSFLEIGLSGFHASTRTFKFAKTKLSNFLTMCGLRDSSTSLGLFAFLVLLPYGAN